MGSNRLGSKNRVFAQPGGDVAERALLSLSLQEPGRKNYSIPLLASSFRGEETKASLKYL